MNFATWGHLMMSILPRYSSFTTFSSSLTTTPDLFATSTPHSTVKENQTTTPLPRLESTNTFRDPREGLTKFKVALFLCCFAAMLQFSDSALKKIGPPPPAQETTPPPSSPWQQTNPQPPLSTTWWTEEWHIFNSSLVIHRNHNVNALTAITSSFADILKQQGRRWRSACIHSKVHNCSSALLLISAAEE